jgi:hypothetical protein
MVSLAIKLIFKEDKNALELIFKNHHKSKAFGITLNRNLKINIYNS